MINTWQKDFTHFLEEQVVRELALLSCDHYEDMRGAGEWEAEVYV